MAASRTARELQHRGRAILRRAREGRLEEAIELERHVHARVAQRRPRALHLLHHDVAVDAVERQLPGQQPEDQRRDRVDVGGR